MKTLLPLLLPLSIYIFSLSSTFSAEVVATSEWTKLGENDTVDSGMHIRIDMTTGEKWIKTVDEAEGHAEKKQNVQVKADGGLVAVDEGESKVNKETTSSSGSSREGDIYDYDMMHRTLSKLPPEEQERMMLPNHVDAKKANPKERKAFEDRMGVIWKERQEQLQAIEEEYVADLPTILKQRISAMEAYLRHPLAGLEQLASSSQDSSVHMEHDQASIVAVLEDLEYQVTDIDMARDFFTLGGWPLLVSLLSDEAHQLSSESNESSATKPNTRDYSQQLHIVQANAAWVLGTSIKNTREFHPLATVPLVMVGKNGDWTTTALDLALHQYSKLAGPMASKETAAEVPSTVLDNHRHKLLYAIGSMLRGNRGAQAHFSSSRGPSILQKILENTLEQAPYSHYHRKAAQRLLSLSHDIISEVKQHPTTDDNLNESLQKGFAWCNCWVSAVQVSSLQQVAVPAIGSLPCEWKAADKETIQSALHDISVSKDSDMLEELMEEVVKEL